MTVFVCVLGGLILLLCLPVSVWVSLGDKPEFWVGWLGFKLKLEEKEKTQKQKERLEKQKAKRAAKEAKKAARAEKKAKKPKNPKKKVAVKVPKTLDDITDMLGLIRDFVGIATGGVLKIIKNLRVHDFDLKIIVAKYDAAETAIECGKTSAYIYGSLAALQNYIKMKNNKVDIKPNFLIDEGSFALSFCVLFTPLIVLGAAFGILFGALWAFIKRELAKQMDKPPQEKPEKVKQ